METLGIKVVDKYTNYNYYIVGNSSAKKVEKDRLLSLIGRMMKSKDHKSPYLRFMYVSGQEEAVCIVMDGKERLSKIIPFSDAEKMFS